MSRCKGRASCLLAGPPCRLLRCLTDLRCFDTEVFLPALAVIAPQLRTLKLLRCLLHTWVAGQGTHAFALGWNELAELDLTQTSVDGKVAAVEMPALKTLEIAGFLIKDDNDGTLLHQSMQAFGHGCPQCTILNFGPLLRLRHAPYADFPALERLQLIYDADSMAKVDGVWHQQDVAVPTSLTSLSCMSAECFCMEYGCRSLKPHQCIPLPAVLSLAAACIRGGAPLRKLYVVHCHTRVADGAGILRDPDWWDIKL